MKLTMLLGAALLSATFPATAAPPAAAAVDEKAAIIQVISRMETAWNSGDFNGYMAGFQNPGVVFVSGGKMQADWQGTLDHYVRDYGGAPERRGTLHFYDMTVDMLAPDAALLISHYHLEKPEHPQEGINTRLFRKIDGKWVIAMNHVSSYEAHSPPAK